VTTIAPSTLHQEPLYLDHAASTPPAEEVVEEMLPWLQTLHANPHSDHRHGQRAAVAIERARAEVAELIGADPEDIVFTSGATEANNLALQGWLNAERPVRRLAVSAIEHKSVLEIATALQYRGVEITPLTVNREGRILLGQETLAAANKDARQLLTLAHVNNEIGTAQAPSEASAAAHARGWRIHMDASQSAGKLPIDVREDAIDFLSVSSHKLYGPGGIGALYIDSELRQEMQPVMFGGGQEAGLRPGTVPAFLAVGFGAAARLALRRMATDAVHLREVAREFLSALDHAGVAYKIVGDPVTRAPGHVSLQLPGIDAEDLLTVVSPELSASTGSACNSGELRASHVLRGLGMDERTASEVVRVSFGRSSTLSQAKRAADIFQSGVYRQGSR
jgi:cysteine desulfurase